MQSSQYPDYFSKKLSSENISYKVLIWIRLITFILPLILLSAVVFQPWVEPKWMFLDPLTAAELSEDCCHSYYGFVSNLGNIIWSATAAICIFAAVLMYLSGNSRQYLMFALSAGLLTGLLALDDTFMLHEVILPSFGIPQNVVLASYAIFALLHVFSSWRVIMSNDYWILLIGGGALFTSVFIDVVFHSLAPIIVYLEDSAKFFGIFCWASFHIVTLISYLTNPWDVG